MGFYGLEARFSVQLHPAPARHRANSSIIVVRLQCYPLVAEIVTLASGDIWTFTVDRLFNPAVPEGPRGRVAFMVKNRHRKWGICIVVHWLAPAPARLRDARPLYFTTYKT